MNRTPQHVRVETREGFALVIALSLMAFILLLVLSLTTLTRVGISSSATQLKTLTARQNALLGLHVALGELQASAGSDTVATGTLAVDSSLGPDDSKLYWTGVWENQGTHDSPRNLSTYQPALLKVLVSGDNVVSDLAAPADAAWPTLVGSNDVSDATQLVQAPVVEIDGGQKNETNRYAYWVGDEGVKATVNISDPYTDLSDERRLLSLPQSGTHLMQEDNDPNSALIGSNFPTNEATLARINTFESLEIALGNGALFSEAHFHDLSLHAKGVLSDQRLGGLRQDLTWMLRNDQLPTGYLYEEPVPVLSRTTAPGPAWSLIKDFYNGSIQLNTSGTLVPQRPLKRIGDPTNHQNVISPMLTQLKLYFNFSFGNEETGVHGGHLRMHLFPVVVVQNPYNAPLAPADYIFRFEQHNTGDATELLVDVETTDGTVRFPLSPSTTGAGYLFKGGNNDRIFGDSSGGNGLIAFNALELGFAPGEVKVLTLKQSELYQGPLNTNLTTHNSSNDMGNELTEDFDDSKSAVIEFQDTLPSDAAPTDPASGSYFYEFQLVNSGVLRFKSKLRNTGNLTFLSSYDGVAYSASSAISATAEQGNNLIIFPKAGFSYKIDIDNIRYLSNFNVRGTHVSQNGYANSGPPTLFLGDFGLGDFTTDNQNNGNGFFGNSHSSTGHSQVGLFEIPDAPEHLMSIGQLQHIDFSVKFINPGAQYDHSDPFSPSYVLGNSIGSPSVLRTLTYYDNGTSAWYDMKAKFDESYRINEALWDGYFFSTLDTTSGAPATDNPQNTRFHLQTPIDTLKENEFAAAENLLIVGAFNINSTSTNAWRALLGGLNQHNLRRLGRLDESSSVQTNLAYLFPRVTAPIGNGFDSDTTSDPTFSDVWNGVRMLTQNEIITLADEIVEEVKARGPFLSLADFINRDLVASGSAESYQAFSGVLQRAIDQSNLNTNLNGLALTSAPSGTNFPEPEFFQGHQFDSAPGVITQADLLTPIAPILAARSDTFRIRAYGESESMDSNTPSEVWVEAIVQRYPEKVSSTEAIETAATADTFGRQFKIISLNWLPPQN